MIVEPGTPGAVAQAPKRIPTSPFVTVACEDDSGSFKPEPLNSLNRIPPETIFVTSGPCK